MWSPSTFSRQIKLSNLTSTSELKLQPLIHSDIVIGVACFTTLLLLFSQEDTSIAIDILFFCMTILYHIIMNKTRTNAVNRNIYLTLKCWKSCQAFFSCIFSVNNVLIKFSTSFHLGGLSCTFVAGRSHFKATWHNK